MEKDTRYRTGKSVLATIARWAIEAVTDDKTGRWSTPKAGELVVGVVWTRYMVLHAPESWEMWVAFAGTLLGWTSLKYASKNIWKKPDGTAA